jgi:hypothetical protein
MIGSFMNEKEHGNQHGKFQDIKHFPEVTTQNL